MECKHVPDPILVLAAFPDQEEKEQKYIFIPDYHLRPGLVQGFGIPRLEEGSGIKNQNYFKD